MIRTVLMLLFWALSILVAGPFLVCFALLSGNINPLYKTSMRLGQLGVRLAGIRIRTEGKQHLNSGQNYIFMSNHASNLDPMVLVPAIPGRCSILVKKELFRIPILGTGMKIADLVPVDRSDREAAIESVNAAVRAVQKGLHMVIFPEGTRSPDGRLLPFKRGPFHLAMDSGVPVIPVTILGTFESWPKSRFALRPGAATVIFHSAIDPQKYGDRDNLRKEVRNVIASALPEWRRGIGRNNDLV